MANYGLGSVLTPKTRPITDEYEAGHVKSFGRRCRTKGCTSDMGKEPGASLWCAKCKSVDEPTVVSAFGNPMYPAFELSDGSVVTAPGCNVVLKGL
jgi:hypothetical protein